MHTIQPTIAAIDLGSNSFHLAIANINGAQLELVVQKSSRVQLALNMHENHISFDVVSTVLETLADFKDIIAACNAKLVSVVGTAALRQASNAQAVTEAIGQLLGVEVQIIEGAVEAQLIHSAVAALHEDIVGRLVIDIGGASTELAVLDDNGNVRARSLPFGCVSVLKRFMPNSIVSPANMQAAIEYCSTIIRQHQTQLEPLVKGVALGCSGTLQAMLAVLAHIGEADSSITKQGVLAACDVLLNDFHRIDDIPIAGLAADRQKLFSSGVVIMLALLETLPISSIEVVSVALREGLLVDYVQREGNQSCRLKLLA